MSSPIAALPLVQLVAATQFGEVAVGPGELFGVDDAEDGGSAVAEFAGRACYQSFDRPNAKTATNATYLAHIKEVGHESVLEHATVTLYFTGVSRAFTHELIRHRHLSPSQLSQRFVDSSTAGAVLPPLIAEAVAAGGERGHRLLDEFLHATALARHAYEKIADDLTEYLDESTDLGGTARRKAAREAARAVLPNATETRIVVTGNYRAWRHFIKLRATEHADAEIRAIAVEVLRVLQRHAPAVFGDFIISELRPGVEVAETEIGA